MKSIIELKSSLERFGNTVHVVDTHSGAYDQNLRDHVTLREGDLVLIDPAADGREMDEYRKLLQDLSLAAEFEQVEDGIEVWGVISGI